MTLADYRDPVFQQLPLATQEGLTRYIEERRAPSHFLTAVLSNDLREAVNRADADNAVALTACVQWLVRHAPVFCWGSRYAVAAWLAHIEEEAR